MLAEILSVGTELLIGQVVNTNATWISQQLAGLGIDVHRVVTVGDNMDRLGEAIDTALGRADLVVCTGGLGPTADDITIEAVARVLGEPLVERPDVLEHIAGIFARRNRRMTDLDRKQALFPASAELIPNPSGTAFGIHVRRGKSRLMAFPGVPAELKTMWATWAAEQLTASGGGVIHSTLLKFSGCTEAELAELVHDLFDSENPTVAPYTASGEVHLRITAKAASLDAAVALLAPMEAAVLERTAQYYFGRDDDTLPSVVGARLRAAGQTVGVAESATGGLLAARITDVAGSSDYFRGGVVAYSVPVKVQLVGVPPEIVEQYGHVSRETTEALARGIRKALDSDWGVGTTGFAGVGPGAPQDQVGLVYVSVCDPAGQVTTREYRWGPHPRKQVKHFATQRALDLLLRKLDERTTARKESAVVGQE